MSIGKRFFIFLFIEFLIAVAIAVAIIVTTLRESSELLNRTDAMRAEIVAHFTVRGYEENGYSRWIWTDSLDNVDSRMGISFYSRGELENIRCETGYINTQSANSIYTDMEATVQAVGGSLDSQKDDIMRVIDEIRSDKFSYLGGNADNIGWWIESNTYSDGQGGKVWYVCFTANAEFEDKLKNWMDDAVTFIFSTP